MGRRENHLFFLGLSARGISEGFVGGKEHLGDCEGGFTEEGENFFADGRCRVPLWDLCFFDGERGGTDPKRKWTVVSDGQKRR